MSRLSRVAFSRAETIDVNNITGKYCHQSLGRRGFWSRPQNDHILGTVFVGGEKSFCFVSGDEDVPTANFQYAKFRTGTDVCFQDSADYNPRHAETGCQRLPACEALLFIAIAFYPDYDRVYLLRWLGDHEAMGCRRPCPRYFSSL